MNKGRLEAFSDGVLAIILTIMVLELKVPESADFESLLELFPVFLSYILSFIYIGIYWNNHHHMMHSVSKVNGKILWANLHLLFWLSLVPFATGWMGENHFAKATLTVYGAMLLMAGVAYWILQSIIIKSQGQNSILKKAVGKDWKGLSSPPLYTLGIILSFFNEWLSGAVYIFVALMWLVPDRRIERVIGEQQ
ncbi:TMEM175 family protein [Flavobacterium sp. 3HN19-14]|uniref:TMEM175 family protein n=1 Tax=Flavobacterium sp. 3HN19-14 TaxID=3448133 RepID=UPI003EE3EB34